MLFWGVPSYNYSIMGPKNPFLIIKAPIMAPWPLNAEHRFFGDTAALFLVMRLPAKPAAFCAGLGGPGHWISW